MAFSTDSYTMMIAIAFESGCGDEAPRNQLYEEKEKNISNFPAACNAIYSLNQYFAFCCMFVSFFISIIIIHNKEYTGWKEKKNHTQKQ